MVVSILRLIDDISFVGNSEEETINLNEFKVDGKKYYLTTNVVDYYGSRYNGQTIQTVALTSMALSKGSYNPETNKELINYLIGEKDAYERNL